LPFCTYSIRWICWRDKLINLLVQIKQSYEIQRINTTRTLQSRTSFQQTNVLSKYFVKRLYSHASAAKQSTTGKFRVPFLRHWEPKILSLSQKYHAHKINFCDVYAAWVFIHYSYAGACCQLVRKHTICVA